MSQVEKTIILHDQIGDDRTIACCAWTSTTDQKKKESKSEEDVKRVVQMLIRDKHTSPLESAVMTFLYQYWDHGSDNPTEIMQMWKEDLSDFRHAVIHQLALNSPLNIKPKDCDTGKYTWMITINFHALMKYRNKHYIFQDLYNKVKEEGSLKYAIEQIENG
jgi:hypothetical protein